MKNKFTEFQCDVLLNTPNKEKCLAYAGIKAGDMVMCSTSGAHKWTLAMV